MLKERLVNYRYLFYPFLIFLFGIVVARGLYGGDSELIIITVITLSMLIAFLVCIKKIKLLLCLIAFFFIGNSMFFIGQASYIVKEYDGVVSVVGRVGDDIIESDYSYRITLDDVKVNGENTKNICLYVTKGKYDKFHTGDVLSFEANLEKVSLFTLNSFNSNYYRNGIGYTAQKKFADIVSYNGYIKVDESIRQSVKSSLYNNLSEENASMCYAVLFGDKSGIDKQTQDSYRNSGIIHILAVSGLHVGFLISLVYGLLKLCRVNRYANFAITTAFIIFYAFLCGFTPSVVRAGIMAIILMLSKLIGRRYDSLNSVALAGFIICIFSPLSALDIGFQMSIFCVLGIALLYPFFFKLFRKLFPTWASRYLSLSLSAQLAILPFLATFGSVYNFLSVFLNLIIVPFFALLYPLLFITVFVVALIPSLGAVLKLAGWGFDGIGYLASIFSSTSLKVTLSIFDFAVIMFIFILMFILSNFFMSKSINKFFLSAVLILCISLSFVLSNINLSHEPSVVYLNSYNSECIVLSSSNNENLVVGQNSIFSRYANRYKFKGGGYLSLDELKQSDVNSLRDYDIEDYYCLNNKSYIDEITKLEENEFQWYGSFKFRYVVENNITLGVQVEFDQVIIFIATIENSNYNNLYQKTLNYISPDLVFTGQNYKIGQDWKSVSSIKNDITDYNYIESGNFCITFNGKEQIQRRLD